MTPRHVSDLGCFWVKVLAPGRSYRKHRNHGENSLLAGVTNDQSSVPSMLWTTGSTPFGLHLIICVCWCWQLPAPFSREIDHTSSRCLPFFHKHHPHDVGGFMGPSSAASMSYRVTRDISPPPHRRDRAQYQERSSTKQGLLPPRLEGALSVGKLGLCREQLRLIDPVALAIMPDRFQ